MARTTIADCLGPLAARWRPADLGNNTDGTLQYVLTDPVADGVTGVLVTFRGQTVEATIATIEAPTATITLAAQDMLDRYPETNAPGACQMRLERKIRIQGDKGWVMRIHAAS